MGAKDGKRLAPKIIFQPLQPVLHSQRAYLCFFTLRFEIGDNWNNR